MPPELRKRAAPVAEPATAPPKKKGPIAKVAAKVKEIVTPKKADTNGSASASNVAVGEVVNLDGFGGEVETNDGVQTSLKALVDESKAGVVLFTYPKASTPGCKFSLSLVVSSSARVEWLPHLSPLSS
jgi:peroxiredoxin Q/BCP